MSLLRFPSVKNRIDGIKLHPNLSIASSQVAKERVQKPSTSALKAEMHKCPKDKKTNQNRKRQHIFPLSL